MTAADFRRIALSFDGAEEGSHMGAVDFRVGGRIFATLASVKDGFGNLMLRVRPAIRASFRPPMHPASLRCSSVTCARHVPSSRLAIPGASAPGMTHVLPDGP